jgi:uncharacterized protein (DUF58 family)
VAGDLLGLCSRARKLPFAGEIVVFPARRELCEIDPPFRDYFGIRPAKGIIEDPAWYEGTREYSGDKPARSIHWKASARLGTLQEKIFQPSTHRKIFFILDGTGFEDLDDRGGFEEALEIVASLAARFSENGASFALATDRRVVGFPSLLPLGRGPEHLGLLLELLARCELRKGGPVPPPREGGSAGAGFVVVSRSPDEYAERYLGFAASRRDRVLFLHHARGEGGRVQNMKDYVALSFSDLLEAEEETP